MTAFINAYMNEENQYFMSAGAGSIWHTWGYPLHRRNLVQDVKVLRCPAIVNYSSTSYQPDDFDTEVAETYGAVYNDAGFDFRGTKYLYDSNNKQISPTQLVLGACAVDSDKKPVHLLNLSNTAANGKPFQIHGNFCNIFFLDGHSESLQEADLQKKFYPNQTGTGATRIAAEFLTE